MNRKRSIVSKSAAGKKAAGVKSTVPLSWFAKELGKALKVPFKFTGKPMDHEVIHGSEADFCISYLYNEIFSKYDDGQPSPEKEAETWKRFHDAERLCRETNWNIAGMADLAHPTEILQARDQIRRLLGSFDWDSCEPFFG